jgi:nucleoside-diphosphate-sugar epimerase
MPENNRKVLITGGAGLIGSLLIKNLGDKYEFSSLDLQEATGVKSTVANIADFDAIQSAFEGVDTVIHLAADADQNGSWESNLPNNFIATYNIFEQAKRAGVKRVIFASSNHAEGGNYTVPPWKHVNEGDYQLLEQDNYELVTEKHRIRPDGYYGVAKAYGEALGSYYNDFHNVSSFHLRIGWVIRDNDPTVSSHGLTLWLSHRDLVQLMDLCISAPDSYRYDIFNATSDNTWKIFDISHAREALGYKPQDRVRSELWPNQGRTKA